MNKRTLVTLIAGLTVIACLPTDLLPAFENPATPDSQATIAAGLTDAVQTIIPEDTQTPDPTATRTRTPTATRTTTRTPETSTEAVASTETVFSTPASGTPATATNITGTPGTAVLWTATSGSPTATLQSRFYGTQPPAIDFGRLRLINKSKAEAYISIQCVTPGGQVSIIEYPVPRRLNVKAPAGKCIVVAWVGGRKMSGSFSLGKSSEKTITMYKDRIAIK
jgi:hypothetical protein